MHDRAAHAARVLAAYQSVRRLPSIIATVLEAGAPVWTGSAGEPVDPDTQFRIGSITKTMTGVLVMQCRDDGLLDLDDPLGRFVPESGYRDVTLRELLSHTSGMQSEPNGPWWERTPGTDFTTLNAANDGSGSIFARGTAYHYSNLGFALLGEVVARVRGSSWAEVLAQRLLRPLGLDRTSRGPVAPAAQGLSVHHLRGALVPEPAHDTGAMAPAGQLWSTVGDLTTFVRFLRDGDDAVLPAATLAEMQRPVTEDYGLATLVAPYPSTVLGDRPSTVLRDRPSTVLGGRPGGHLVGHLGSMPGFQACALIDPVTGGGLVALTNGTTGFDGVELAARMLGDRTPAPVEPWRPSAEVPEWAEELLGAWYWGNSAFEARWHNDRLELHDVARHRLAEQFGLREEDGCVVGLAGYHHGEILHRHRREDGSIGHLECATFVYTRVPYDPEAPIPGGVPAD